MESIIKKDIMAIVPKYIHNKGNCTIIYTETENIEVERSIKTVIRNISKYYHFDLKESNNTYGKLLFTKKNPPIPFTSKDIFILVKTRKPIGQHDGAYGYVKIDSIEKIEYKKDKDKNPHIILKNKESIETLCTIRTLQKNLRNGEIIERLLDIEHSNHVYEDYSTYLDGDKPATKSDIALLCVEILKLKQ